MRGAGGYEVFTRGDGDPAFLFWSSRPVAPAKNWWPQDLGFFFLFTGAASKETPLE